jgi:uncharacterized protein (TIRG00374 family)
LHRVADVRKLRPLWLVAGLVIVGVVVMRVGIDAARAAAASALSWQTLALCLPFAAIMAVETLGWRYAFPQDRARFFPLVSARVAGEAVNTLTAVAPVGGDAVKVWFLRGSVPVRDSVASVIIAKTTITLAQLVFLALGAALAWHVAVDQRLVRGLWWLLLLEGIGVGGFVLVQLAGTVSRGAWILRRVGVVDSVAAAEHLDQALQRYYRSQWRRFALSVTFHFAGALLGALETLLFLHALGLSASLTTAILVEALISAVRFVTFFVPGSLGAVEGAAVGAFGALGLGTGAGLAFSLLRRIRQAVWIGLGVLVIVLSRTPAQAAPETGVR